MKKRHTLPPVKGNRNRGDSSPLPSPVWKRLDGSSLADLAFLGSAQCSSLLPRKSQDFLSSVFLEPPTVTDNPDSISNPTCPRAISVKWNRQPDPSVKTRKEVKLLLRLTNATRRRWGSLTAASSHLRQLNQRWNVPSSASESDLDSLPPDTPLPCSGSRVGGLRRNHSYGMPSSSSTRVRRRHARRSKLRSSSARRLRRLRSQSLTEEDSTSSEPLSSSSSNAASRPIFRRKKRTRSDDYRDQLFQRE